MKEKIMPEIQPGIRIIIRMNGDWEWPDGNVKLRKRNAWSDIIVTTCRDGSFGIASRICNAMKDAAGKRMNDCALTIEQTRMLNYVLVEANSVNLQK